MQAEGELDDVLGVVVVEGVVVGPGGLVVVPQRALALAKHAFIHPS